MFPETQHYLERIEDLRGQVGALLASLPEPEMAAALNWRPLEGSIDHATNSLAVLAVHVAGAEHFWIGEMIGGLPNTRDRDAEFLTTAANASELIARLDALGQETRAVLAGLTPANLDETRSVRGRTLSVRWMILHVIDHTALHLGHMQLTYQLWMGGKTGRSPRWFERVAPKP